MKYLNKLIIKLAVALIYPLTITPTHSNRKQRRNNK